LKPFLLTLRPVPRADRLSQLPYPLRAGRPLGPCRWRTGAMHPLRAGVHRPARRRSSGGRAAAGALGDAALRQRRAHRRAHPHGGIRTEPAAVGLHPGLRHRPCRRGASACPAGRKPHAGLRLGNVRAGAHPGLRREPHVAGTGTAAPGEPDPGVRSSPGGEPAARASSRGPHPGLRRGARRTLRAPTDGTDPGLRRSGGASSSTSTARGDADAGVRGRGSFRARRSSSASTGDADGGLRRSGGAVSGGAGPSSHGR